MFKGGRCLCINPGAKVVKMAAIKEVSVIYPSNGCDKVEVIVTLKAHKGQRCLDPASKQARLIMQTIQKKNFLRRQNMWRALKCELCAKKLTLSCLGICIRFARLQNSLGGRIPLNYSAWLWKYLSRRVMCLCVCTLRVTVYGYNGHIVTGIPPARWLDSEASSVEKHYSRNFSWK